MVGNVLEHMLASSHSGKKNKINRFNKQKEVNKYESRRCKRSNKENRWHSR